MPSFDFDLFVIGAGSGGVRAARMAAAAGAKVAVAEEYRYGGTCVIRGCIPKKLLVYASHFGHDFEDAVGYGWTVESASFDWTRLIANKDKEIARLEGIYRSLLTSNGCTLFPSRARIAGENTIEVDGKRVTARTVLIATGGRPVKPDIPGADLGITSNEVFQLERLPKRVLVLGGGYIACEFATIFHRLGVETTLVYRGEQILRGFDQDIRRVLAEDFVKDGIDLRLNLNVLRLDQAGGGLRAQMTDGGTLDADQVLFATGRNPNTGDLGLETAGIETTSNGAIKVDGYSRSSQSDAYAIGDVTDRLQLTPVALAEAMAFVDTLYRGRPRALDYDLIPSAVFSQPPIATVGITEEEARRRHDAVEIYRTTFKPLKHTLSGRDERSMMKLVVESKSRRVLGAHMVGMDAAEIVQGVAIALRAGATKDVFDATVGIHPTAAEEFVTLREPVAEPDRKKAAE
ncbi:MAG: glutathione-disulfide reductase [Kiloniellales bacterium]